ncbi:MAG: hypothetical protein OXH70_02090 [Acidobacteria bacterium]|nr:hypothetical protein [Acidobacteriota bacterium]
MVIDTPKPDLSLTAKDFQFGDLVVVGFDSAEEAAEYARSQSYEVKVEEAR